MLSPIQGPSQSVVARGHARTCSGNSRSAAPGRITGRTASRRWPRSARSPSGVRPIGARKRSKVPSSRCWTRERPCSRRRSAGPRKTIENEAERPGPGPGGDQEPAAVARPSPRSRPRREAGLIPATRNDSPTSGKKSWQLRVSGRSTGISLRRALSPGEAGLGIEGQVEPIRPAIPRSERPVKNVRRQMGCGRYHGRPFTSHTYYGDASLESVPGRVGFNLGRLAESALHVDRVECGCTSKYGFVATSRLSASTWACQGSRPERFEEWDRSSRGLIDS